MIQKKQIIQIKRGLFETDANAPPYALASSIYGPSYLSFEYALYRWDFIHDRVRTFTSAAFQKNKSKEFVTPFGFFSYESIGENVFPYAVTVLNENGYSYQIATAEKALCDLLYKAHPVKNIWELKKLLFETLRLDESNFYKLNKNDIKFLAPRYKRKNLLLLANYIDELNTGAK